MENLFSDSLIRKNFQEYAKLVETENEINLLDKLYGLYQKTQSTFGLWNELPFLSVQEDCAKMVEIVENFQRDWKSRLHETPWTT